MNNYHIRSCLINHRCSVVGVFYDRRLIAGVVVGVFYDFRVVRAQKTLCVMVVYCV